MSIATDSQDVPAEQAVVPPSPLTRTCAEPSRIRVEVADGHFLLAHALARVLSQESDIDVIGVRRELDIVSLRRTRPDVLVLGYFLMLSHGPEFIEELRREISDLRILVLTATLDEETLACCVRFGTVGCVTKSQHPEELAIAIRQVALGQVLFSSEILVRLLRAEVRRAPDVDSAVQPLRPREVEVLTALASGQNAVEIAHQMVISPHTVRSHLRSALTKLRARSRAEAIAIAVRRGLIDPMAVPPQR
jgi:DNA-binding NarL/FixJ family response regulator